VAICFFLSTRTALAHEKWFHEGPWAPANWRNLAQLPTAALIAGVVVITIVPRARSLRIAWRVPTSFPGRSPRGRPDGITRFYALVPVILAIHVAVPLLVYGIQGHLFVPYLNLHGVWQYWLGLIQVGAAVALFYGGLTRLAAIAIGVAWLTGIGVFGLEPMLEIVHYVGFAAFFFLAGRGPFSIDHLLFPRWDPPTHMMRLAPSALRIGVGISLVMVAFTEKLANPQLALSFLQQHPLNFTAALGMPMSDATFVLCAGSVELLIGLFVVFGLFPRLIILFAWFPFNLTLTIFVWLEMFGHLSF
jgi:uncharacterized membrane protein YphA (DoxX/SURF4 family)